MKKYYLADALSALEIILALVLILAIIGEVEPDIAIWIFVAGELCDAFDGICARRWPYPNDGKFRWWRIPRVVQFIEHLSDILLISALAFYLLSQNSLIIQCITLFIGIAIAVFCIWIELCLRCFRFQTPLTPTESLKLIRRRRYVYLFGIAVGIIELIFCTNWPQPLKYTLCAIGAVIGVALAILKWDRFTETHETFREFWRRRIHRH